MAESITEGTLKQWLKQKGDYVEADEEVATIETDKVRFTLPGTRRAHSGATCCTLPPSLRTTRRVPRLTPGLLSASVLFVNDDIHRSTSLSTRPKPAS